MVYMGRKNRARSGYLAHELAADFGSSLGSTGSRYSRGMARLGKLRPSKQSKLGGAASAKSVWGKSSRL